MTLINKLHEIDNLYNSVVNEIDELLKNNKIQNNRPMARTLESIKNEFVIKSKNYNSSSNNRLNYIIQTLKESYDLINKGS